MQFTLALAQIDSRIGDAAWNARHHLELTRRAREGGADLVVFPELSLTGYSIKDAHADATVAPGRPGPLAPLLEESREIAIAVGCVEESDAYGLHNAVFYLEHGEVTAVHRKIYPPT